MNPVHLEPLWSALARAAEALPARPLLSQGDRCIDAAGLLAAIERAAATLAAADVRVLALAMPDGPDWLAVDLACALAGVVSIPVPPFFSPRQIAHLLEAAAVDAIAGQIGSAGQLDSTGQLGSTAGAADFRPAAMLLPGVALARRALVPAAGIPPGTAKITFTSGSTGTPKGVCLSLEQQLRVAAGVAAAVGNGGIRHLCALPLATLLENVAGIYAPLLAGGSVEFAPTTAEGQPFGIAPARLPATLEHCQPQSLILVPELLRGLVAAARAGWIPPRSLRFVAVGGGRVAPELIAAARALGLPVYEGYGLSECGSVVSLNRPGADAPGSVGQPLRHVRVATRDGELVVSGNTFLGYLNEPASWHQTEVATDDLGHIDERGFLHVDGRRDHLIVTTQGRNIAPEWLEAELLATGPLRHALVIGHDRPHCAALLWPISAETPAAKLAEHLAHVNAGLPGYARIRAWRRMREPLTADSGLITGNGRLRRTLVAARFAECIDSLYSQPMEAVS
ncbi:MAG TPA: AMP-binding protein [Porticoccaceae bacterium]|nr:AMP-binding protein [Porticoccaceae bacterium]